MPGGGPGHVGIALAQRLPLWQGVLCDEPETAAVAQENIDAAGLSGRVQALGCDLNTDGIGSGHDLIWCSAVLHFMRDPQALVHKAWAALKPGGRLLLAHAEQVDDPEVAARVLPFYSTLAVRGNHLPRTGAVGRMLAEAGLAEVQSLGAWISRWHRCGCMGEGGPETTMSSHGLDTPSQTDLGKWRFS